MSSEALSPAAFASSALRNAIRYDAPHTPFCDGFSHFSVAFPAGQPLGGGWLHPKAHLSTYHLAEPLAELWFEAEDGQLLAARRTDLESLPHLAIEHAELATTTGPVAVLARHVFASPDTLVSDFTFTSPPDHAAVIRPRWIGRLPGETQTYMLPYFVGARRGPRDTFLIAVPGGLFGGLASGPDSDLAHTAIRITAPKLKTWLGETPFWCASASPKKSARLPRALRGAKRELHYAFAPAAPVRLAAGQSISFRLVTTLTTVASGEKLTAPAPAADLATPFATLAAAALARFEQNIRAARAPAAPSPALVSAAWRARFALLRNGLAPAPKSAGEFGSDLACLCTSDASDFSCVFFWDTLFSSVALSDFHPAYARGALRTAFVRQDARDGSAPERKFQWGVPARMAQQSPQSPLASWALRRHLAQNPDPALQRALYPLLVANHRFWEHHSDTDRDGLAEYRWSGQVSDNSPMWDPYSQFGDGAGCGWVPPVASVPLNCFLLWDARHLARHAADLGLKPDARAFAKRADELQERLLRICHVPAEKRFWDYNHHTRTHTKVKTFWMFWPLFAGVEMPRSTRDDLLKTLLDPAQFFGAIPFPSVAYDEPTYDARGYWRGRAWPHVSYFLLQTLVRHGHEKAARAAAARLLSWYSRQTGFLENICTHAAETRPHGFPDYNWGSAAFYLLATGDYLRPDRWDV